MLRDRPLRTPRWYLSPPSKTRNISNTRRRNLFFLLRLRTPVFCRLPVPSKQTTCALFEKTGGVYPPFLLPIRRLGASALYSARCKSQYEEPMPALTCRRSKLGTIAAFAGSLLALALIASAPALAQKPMCHAMGMRDELPPDKLPAPEKIAGVGNVHLKITAAPEVQMWFDQGLNLYHDFWDYESARAFQQAIRIDPNCAMCYWGLYQAQIFYHSNSRRYAKQALDEAARLEHHASKAERLYIESSVEHEKILDADAKK